MRTSLARTAAAAVGEAGVGAGAVGAQASLPVRARTRPLPAHKAHLYASHAALLTRSPLLVFLKPGDLTADEWRALRAKLPNETRLSVLRAGLVKALIDRRELDLDDSRLSKHVDGPLAVLSLRPTAHAFSDPAILARALDVLARHSRAPHPSKPAPATPKGARPEQQERLPVLSALIDSSHAVSAQDAKDRIARLPNLDVLRAQIVGVIASPAQSLASTLGANAQAVARALQGLKLALEQK